MKAIPYIILSLSIIVSTIIGMLNGISFSVFLKRTSIFYIIIFFSAKIFIENIVKGKKMFNDENKIDMVVHDKIPMNSKENEDAFTPLDLGKYEEESISKIINDGGRTE